jgi:hypothetical protein
MLFSVVIIARLLYFAQFTFNAIFLTTVIYRLRNMGGGKTPMPTPYRLRSQSVASQSTPYRPRTRSAASQSTPYRPRTRSTASQYRHQHHSGADVCMARLSPSSSSRDCFIDVPEKGDTAGVYCSPQKLYPFPFDHFSASNEPNDSKFEL